MEQQKTTLAFEQSEALQIGFIQDFHVTPSGVVYHELHEVHNPQIITVITCMLDRASLYLIKAGEAYGTWVDYWES